ncbi:putative NAD+ diphosphatase [Kockovaella imperatae]|uniref:NAD(+) diphosphatase n=1 Tax=Kockovaella imperatae TaxID=4999 RepID=A0A1Y1ULI6_9TREE|nr:putative NAD+ diphosphatase [Kockovaella imperatae]ORX38346.1 putative NAD+ diphosphatase [Kockovaella imperatae]
MGDNLVNFYAGQPPLNRLSFIRPSVDKINALLNAESTRFIAFKDLKPLVQENELGKLVFLDRKAVESRIGDGYMGSGGDSKEAVRTMETYRKPSDNALVFLGIDDRTSARENIETEIQSSEKQVDLANPPGTAFFAVDAGRGAEGEWEISGTQWGDPRSSASSMSGWEAGLFAQARALIDWNTRNRFCPMCGSQTYSLWAGWKRGCITGLEPIPGKEPCPSLEGLHNFAYPRTDPVIIMGILNSAGDKILLGRQAKWPKGMYSCLAGFVEPGESFEDAVRREVMEEAGIEVGPVRYSSSQPWPYPANLMVGCFGRAKDGQRIRFDLDNELEDAQWFDRPTIRSLVSSPTGSKYSEAEIKRLGKLANSGSNHKDDQETANALAPSERKTGEGDAEGDKRGLTRVPPDTAIAGKLIRLWADGGVDLVSRL